VPWLAINQNQVFEYILHLKGQSYAEATVARKVAAVKSFFSFLQAEGKVKVNPTETLASPKGRQVPPQTFDRARIDELLEQPMRRLRPRPSATAPCSS
jgi:integrase/recombinase XerD